ncbi:MAG: XdhC family protein, partial [Elusimicrobia bacterium]|nr:XdhC family protein [Elusimicrobiota bacterium]
MGAPRPHEALSVLRALEDLASADPLSVRGVLATLVTVDGALHERSGALALFCDDDAAAGMDRARAVGTLPDGLREAVARVLAERAPASAEFSFDEDETLFGPGGLTGRAEAWLEPVTGDLRETLRQAREALLRGEGLVVELLLAGDEPGRRRQLPPDHPGARACYAEGQPELDEEAERGTVRRVFRLPLIPMGKALLVGSGEDARRLAELLDRLGFIVTVVDHRPGRLHGEGWDRARWQLVEGGWTSAREAARPDADTVVVVMTHSLSADGRALKGALLSPARYVGLVGAAGRAAKLLAELKEKGVEPRPGVLSAPAGLETGAETPEEVALSIAAEILAVRFGRKGGRPARLRPAGSAPSGRKGGVKVP